ncbi:MAG: hypothetical protein F4Z08_09100 [Chloroflexi bacterium]|nr:hypothetical protein [Chloroflexota bacterium]
MDLHHITVAVLIVGLVSEAVGGYFDFRLRIVPGPRDHHAPALAVSRLSPNSLWWSIWMKWVSVPDTDAAVETVWRFTEWAAPIVFVRNIIRVVIGAFFIVKVALIGSPY